MGASKDQLWDLHEDTENPQPLEFSNEINPEAFGLELVKAQDMVSGLTTTIVERSVLRDAYLDVIELPINAETLPIFKELRLKIVKNRTQGIEKWHKTNKAFYLAGGRFVDAIKNKEVLVNEEMEAKLLEGEKYFENLEKEAKRVLNLERIERVKPYIEDAYAMDFSEMNDYDFDDFVLGKKTRFENEAKERESEAKRLEAERLSKIEKQKEIEAENAILKAKLDAERLEAQRLAKIEADKNDKLEAELKAKLDAENEAKKIEAERLEYEKKEAEQLANAPIKEQLNIWVNNFELPSRTIINEQSDEIVLKFEAFKKWAKNQVNQ
jgi:glycerol-3-phosphate cytidylyltransferase-like family protein